MTDENRGGGVSTTNSRNLEYIHSVLLSFVPILTIFFLVFISNSGLFLTIVLFVLGNVIGYTTLSSLVYLSIYWRSSLLCNTFLTGYLLVNHNQTYSTLNTFGFYLMCLSFFHLSEFIFTALFNSKDVSTDSFLLNHSLEYGVAAVASWTEFFIEAFFFPGLKLNLYLRFFGLSLIIFGETFRKLAMYTAGTNFNHYVQETRQQDHVLVTKGIYSFVRHPSYFGWFYWCIGTQLLLANPICTILYGVAAWKFFQDRIVFEEYYLIRFFGKQYAAYQKKVPSGIPFVKGYTLVDECLD
jgi:protein-S-isoprenylcysteine O-methyltransferase